MKTIGLKVIWMMALVGASAVAQTDTISVQKKQRVPFHQITPENAFEAHVKQHKIQMYIIGGIVSAVREKELEFAKKYHLTFHDFGCVVPANLNFYTRYNELVFEHLTRTFGVEWQKEISPNVLGISQYKEKI